MLQTILYFLMRICFVALDFVGHETSVTSEGITIDTSPPRVDRDQIYVSSNYLTTDNSIQISYTNGVITDPESGEL